MIAVIATMRVQDGQGPQFEQEFTAFAAKVRKDEPHIQLYQLTRSRSEPNTYRIMEIYPSQAAVDAHSAYLQKAAPTNNLGRLFSAPPELEFLDCVG
jgi:quinol monooxygenase YgiN